MGGVGIRLGVELRGLRASGSEFGVQGLELGFRASSSWRLEVTADT